MLCCRRIGGSVICRAGPTGIARPAVRVAIRAATAVDLCESNDRLPGNPQCRVSHRNLHETIESIEPRNSAEQPFAEQMKPTDRAILFAAEGFGLGRIPFAPGTFGSLWGLPLGWLFCYGIDWRGRLTIGAALFLAGIPLCGRAAELRHRKDPGSVVWDEIAAFPLVYAFVPIHVGTLLAGFVLFRIIDIAKPPPIRKLERLGGGLGIMIDDQIAAVWAACLLTLLVRMIP